MFIFGFCLTHLGTEHNVGKALFLLFYCFLRPVPLFSLYFKSTIIGQSCWAERDVVKLNRFGWIGLEFHPRLAADVCLRTVGIGI